MIETKDLNLILGAYEKGLGMDVRTNLHVGVGSAERTIGLDMGSTNNRTVPFNPDAEEEDELFGSVVEASSDLGIVGDISHIKSNSNKVYDNLEFIIKDITTPETKPEKMFVEEHFVKYGLYKSVSNETLARPSNISKVNLESTYLNAIATMAIDIYNSINKTGVVVPCYRIKPSVALPPEDFKSAIFIDKFKTTLAGHYEVVLPRLGVKFNILIEKENIFVDKEPNAVVFQLANTYESILQLTSVIIDGGGKSIDVSIVIDGVLVEKGSGTISYGGARLIEDIREEYVRVKGKSAPNEAAIISALETGILIRGKNEENIQEIIKSAKDTMARRIYNDLLKIFDRASLSIDDIGFTVFHGRLFEETEGAGRVSDVIEEMFAKVNDNIESCVVTDTATIATGVVISRLVDEE